MQALKQLIIKELKTEFRERNAFQSVLLYILSSGFICFLAFRQIIQPQVWNALFWIILLFNTMNSVAKSFLNESNYRFLYHYSLYSARDFILSKIIYNGVMALITATLTFVVIALFIGHKIQDFTVFFIVITLSSFTLSTILSLVSAIASRASGNFTLVSILSFPLTIPLLLISIKLTKNAMDGLAFSVSYLPMLSLLSLLAICLTLSLLLFPYLWRD